MSKNKIEISLRLVPFIKEEEILVAQEKVLAPSDWLENDAEELPSEIHPSKNELNKTTEKIAEENKRIFKCDILQIKQKEKGFELSTNNGAVILQDHDIIILPNAHLKVYIIKEHVIAIEEQKENIILPMQEEDDIWTSSHMTSNTNRFADPFANQTSQGFSQFQNQIQQDPLDFLYESKSNTALHNNKTNTTLPAIEGFSPYPSSTFGESDLFANRDLRETAGLHVNTTDHYYRAHSPQDYKSPNHEHFLKQAPLSSEQIEEGNVLHDLGINEQSSIIINKQYTAGKSSFLDQSPLDLIDEYLDVDEENHLGYDHGQSCISHPNEFHPDPNYSEQRHIGKSFYSPSDTSKSSIPSGIKGFAKKAKRAVKAFTENN